ncbi:MAG: hypothetical protein KA436_01295 [Oligoflexales bacterium]|nr:hypothetical protein [Oligoflexales bacterium]
MTVQVDKRMFASALRELGHDPSQFEGQKLSLENMAQIYEFETDALLEAIEKKALNAHYDYKHDHIWIDALEAAHFYYCVYG